MRCSPLNKSTYHCQDITEQDIDNNTNVFSVKSIHQISKDTQEFASESLHLMEKSMREISQQIISTEEKIVKESRQYTQYIGQQLKYDAIMFLPET